MRQRLQARIAGLKGTRGAGEKKKKKRKEKTKADERPAKHARTDAPEDTKVGALRDARAERPTPKLVQGAPGSKTRKLKGLLKQAERDAAEVRHLRASGQDAAADDRQWDEALRVASGERAAVDPAKVKKALKLREKKKKRRSPSRRSGDQGRARRRVVAFCLVARCSGARTPSSASRRMIGSAPRSADDGCCVAHTTGARERGLPSAVVGIKRRRPGETRSASPGVMIRRAVTRGRRRRRLVARPTGASWDSGPREGGAEDGARG